MKWLLYLLLPLFFAENAPLPESSETNENSVTIYFFVSEKCPICQYYTSKINTISAEFPKHEVVLVFPNDLSNEETMEQFKEKYQLSAKMMKDADHELVQKFDITVTPEVIVYIENEDTVLYQGRIDDNYYRVGKRKLTVQSDDLVNALQAIENETTIANAKTTPVGCYISQKPKK